MMETETTKPQTAKLTPTQSRALAAFDTLPDSAQVPVQVVAALMSVTTPTIWKWASSGKFAKPVRLGAVTRWRVGEVRRSLAAVA